MLTAIVLFAAYKFYSLDEQLSWLCVIFLFFALPIDAIILPEILDLVEMWIK